MTDLLDNPQSFPSSVSPPGWRFCAAALVASGLLLLAASDVPGVFSSSRPLALEAQLLTAVFPFQGLLEMFGADIWWCLWVALSYRWLQGLLSPAGAVPVVVLGTVLLAFAAFWVCIGTLVGGASVESDPLAVLFWFMVWGGVLIGGRSWRWWSVPVLSLVVLLLLWANVPLRLAVAISESELAALADEARMQPRTKDDSPGFQRWRLPQPRRVGWFTVYAVGIDWNHGITTFQTDRGNDGGLALVTQRITRERLLEERLVQFTARGCNLNYQNLMPLGGSWYGYSWYQD